MEIDEIIDYLAGMEAVLTLMPQPGDGSPEISWGDAFFYYAPDGVVPKTQPFATIVTKDYPDDRRSRLDRPHAFRVNIAAGAEEFGRWTGHPPQETNASTINPSTADVVLPPSRLRRAGLALRGQPRSPGGHAGQGVTPDRSPARPGSLSAATGVGTSPRPMTVTTALCLPGVRTDQGARHS